VFILRIFTVEECQEFVKHSNYLPFTQNILTNEKNKKYWNVYLANYEGYCYQHKIERIKQNIDMLVIKYPQLTKPLESVEIYLSPLPALGFHNAEIFNNKEIIFFSRGTPIPQCMTDYVTVHECGHIAQHYFAPNDPYHDNTKWRKYLELRNIPKGLCKVFDYYDKETKKDVFREEEDFICMNGSTMSNDDRYPKYWHERPTEWFAEDFRFIYNNINDYSWGLGEYGIPRPNERVQEFITNLGL